jgi:hypothetical protein
MTTKLNTRRLIATAAAELPAPFTAAQIVVAAWQLSPQRLGLAGFADLYPDSNKVLSVVWGQKGMIGQGQIAKAGKDLRLTDRGRTLLAVPALSTAPAALDREPPAQKLPLPLYLATCSFAYAKFSSGAKNEIGWIDARLFWGADLAGPLGERIDAMESLLADRDVPELRPIRACHDWLTERFARRIQLEDGTLP